MAYPTDTPSLLGGINFMGEPVGSSQEKSGLGDLFGGATLDYTSLLGGKEESGGFLGDFLSNKNDMMGGLAGLLGAGLQFAALPSALKNAKLTNKMNQANLSAFTQDRATHNTRKTNMDNVAQNFKQSMVA